jgi:hypothetical protein
VAPAWGLQIKDMLAVNVLMLVQVLALRVAVALALLVRRFPATLALVVMAVLELVLALLALL